jgi:hypothetical protein
MLQGVKTIAFNAGMIGAVAMLQYLSEVSWVEHLAALGPTGALVAPMLVFGINMALRWMTTSPVLGRKAA